MLVNNKYPYIICNLYDTNDIYYIIIYNYHINNIYYILLLLLYIGIAVTVGVFKGELDPTKKKEETLPDENVWTR